MDPLTLAFLAGLAVTAAIVVLGGPRVVADAGAEGDGGSGVDGGSTAERACPHCGATNAAGYDYCGVCVESLEPAGDGAFRS